MHGQFWVREFSSTGRFQYRPEYAKDRSFDEPLAALEYLVAKLGREFVNNHFSDLVSGITDGTIVWISDKRAVGLSLIGEREDQSSSSGRRSG